MRVLSAIMFHPRGGSAHATRAQVEGLRRLGWDVTLVSGSRTGAGGAGDAHAFYGEVKAVDFDPALASANPSRFEGPAGTAPMQPSFEDRPGAPDVVFARLDDLDYERQVRAWARELAAAGAARCDVALLHHLTPLHEAMARVAPHVPVVTQLHGTELLMLEQIASGAPATWQHAARWARRLREWAARSERLLVAPSGRERAGRMLELEPERFVALPSGVETELFAPRPVDRLAHWRRVLVEEPRGWAPGREPGSIRYAAADVERLASEIVLLSVSRFTQVKRVPALLAAFAQACERSRTPASLVLVGGYPGEWEGEHPAQAIARLDARGIFLAGWYPHDRLPAFFNAADAVVTASAREQFGLTLVEGMACRLPVVATRSPGPELIVRDGETGWLAGADAGEGLVEALVAAIDEHAERRRRGVLAMARVHESFSWTGITHRLAAVLRAAALHPEPGSAAAGALTGRGA